MKKKTKSPAPRNEVDIPPLSAKEIAEFKRQIADSRDPTRYAIVSAFTRRFCLYYMPESGNYISNEIPPEAMFKRRAEAEAVAKVLDRGRSSRRGQWTKGRRKLPRHSLQVIAVKKTERGVRILEEIADPWNKGKRWKPVLRRRNRQETKEA